MLETTLFWLLLAVGALFLSLLLKDHSDEGRYEPPEYPPGKPLV